MVRCEVRVRQLRSATPARRLSATWTVRPSTSAPRSRSASGRRTTSRAVPRPDHRARRRVSPRGGGHDVQLLRRGRAPGPPPDPPHAHLRGRHDADIAEPIATDHGLTPELDLHGPTHRVVASSTRATSRSFASSARCRRRRGVARRHDPPRPAERPTATIATSPCSYGASLSAFHVRADLCAPGAPSWRVAGWDPSRPRTAMEETADSVDLGAELGVERRVRLPTSWRDAFDERHERLVVAEALTTDDARAGPRAAYLERARRFVTGTGTHRRHARHPRGRAVSPSSRLGDLFDGEYRVVRDQPPLRPRARLPDRVRRRAGRDRSGLMTTVLPLRLTRRSTPPDRRMVRRLPGRRRATTRTQTVRAGCKVRLPWAPDGSERVRRLGAARDA